MNIELYTVKVTLDATVDNSPRQRTYYVVTSNGPVGAMNSAFNRIASLVTDNPDEKTTEMIIAKVCDNSFVADLEITEQHADGQ